MSLRRASVVLGLVAMVCAGCEVGPNYQPPAVPTPPAFAETTAKPAAPLSATTAAKPDLARWWRVFGDPTLDSLVSRALSGDYDVASAISRVRAAREQVIIAGAALWPEVNAAGSVNNTLLSKNAGLATLQSAFSSAATGGGGGAGGVSLGTTGIGRPGTDFTTFAGGLDASWELDLFGQTRRSVEAARGRAEAQVWSLRDTEVSVAAEVALDYLELRSLQQQIAVSRREAQRQQQLVDIIGARREAGYVTGLDVSQQRTQLTAALAAIPNLEAATRAEIHALGVLTGEPPEALSAELTPAAATPAVPPVAPVGLPSELLRRRPDVLRAERNLAAATADIGVATGALYPQINLTGSADLISESLRTLLSAGSIQTAATAMVVQTIFNAGKTRANIRATREARLEAYDAYQQTVLTALKEVEDALARYAGEQRRNQQLRASEEAAENAYSVASDRWRSGLTNFIDVLAAEGAVFNAQDLLAQSDGALGQDLVSLYKALGGGWPEES